MGDQGEAVRILQTRLNNWGFPLFGEHLQPTGTFNEATEAALKEFERFFGLKEDGIFDPLDSEILWIPRGEALTAGYLQLGTNMGADAVPYLKLALHSQDPSIRGRAAFALGELGAEASSAAPQLVPLLTDDAVANGPGTRVSDFATEALANIGSAAEPNEIVPALLEQLRAGGFDGDSAALALLRVDPSLSVLLENLNAESLKARESSAFALGFVDSPDQSVLNALLSVVEDASEDPNVRMRAANSLTMLGEDVQWFYTQNGFEAVYAEWESCPRRPSEVTAPSDSRTFFDPLETKAEYEEGEQGACTTNRRGGSPIVYLWRMMGGG
ncbi:MAG: HEAT repeat domain-containing protein [Cyanobacteria bacterium J06638_20]